MIDNTALCSKLTEMLRDDQKYRSLHTSYMTDRYPKVLDSLKSELNLHNRDNSVFSKERMDAIHRKARQLAMYSGAPNIMNSDSIRNLQRKIDDMNTRNLIRIVKEKGWVNQSVLGCKNRLRTVLIFRHAPKNYWKQIRKIIEVENFEKRLSGYEYHIIDNHLKGRPPLTKKPSDFIDK